MTISELITKLTEFAPMAEVQVITDMESIGSNFQEIEKVSWDISLQSVIIETKSTF